MKIQDAKPGDVLRDKGGALWLRGERRARLLMSEDETGDMVLLGAYPRTFDMVEFYGPFTRLVPEQETP